MDMQHLAYIMAVFVGVVSSGLIGSAWQLATGEEARLKTCLILIQVSSRHFEPWPPFSVHQPQF